MVIMMQHSLRQNDTLCDHPIISCCLPPCAEGLAPSAARYRSRRGRVTVLADCRAAAYRAGRGRVYRSPITRTGEESGRSSQGRENRGTNPRRPRTNGRRLRWPDPTARGRHSTAGGTPEAQRVERGCDILATLPDTAVCDCSAPRYWRRWHR